MKYEGIVVGRFLARPNRFIAEVEIAGEILRVHVKNTGRCKELLVPNAKVLLEKSTNPNRKTPYSLIAVYKGDVLINMDSQVPNAVVAEALQAGIVAEIGKVDFLKREVTYGDSRFDVYYEKTVDGKLVKGFVEVKGVTLEVDGVAKFPDAPTSRGAKHLHGLIAAKEAGYEAAAMFLVQMQGCHTFMPNKDTDPKFAQSLIEAKNAGVKILVYDAVITEDEIVIGGILPFDL